MMYKVRVLLDDSRKTEVIKECKSRSDAFDLFKFYVLCELELGVSIWCCNILNGKRCIRMYSKH